MSFAKLNLINEKKRYFTNLFKNIDFEGIFSKSFLIYVSVYSKKFKFCSIKF